jgi:type II secretory pathway pseudopilin PulG
VIIAVILLLAGLVVAIANVVMNKSARNLAQTQIKELSLACERYRTDHGSYPQSADTDALDPQLHFAPTAPGYAKACLHLYSCLAGDHLPAGAPDGKPDPGESMYHTFKPKELMTGPTGTVSYIRDPFGQCYGYSTIGATTEADYRAQLKISSTVARPNPPQGYNPTFDLWSTGNGTTAAQTGKWVKNWPEN